VSGDERKIMLPSGGQPLYTNRVAWAVTTCFSPEARDYAERVNARLVLIDGPEIANLMIEHNCGVVVEETFNLKQVDENFFGDL
jgi:restriction system protein